MSNYSLANVVRVALNCPECKGVIFLLVDKSNEGLRPDEHLCTCNDSGKDV